MTPEQEVWDAERARQVIEDPLVKRALDELEKQCIDNLEICPMNDLILRDKVWMLFQVTRKFRQTFLTMMESGKMARVEIEQKRRWFGAGRK